MATVKMINSKKGVSYKITVCNGYDNNNKKIVQTTTYKPDETLTQKQREKALNKFVMEFEEKVKNGFCFDGDKITFEKFSERWLESVKEKLAYSSYIGYEQVIRTRILPYFGHYKVSKIKLHMIEEFYKTQFDNCTYGTVKKCANILSGMFKSAIRWDMIQTNPCKNAEIPKTYKRNDGLKYFTPNQSLNFLQSLDRVYESVYKAHDRVDDTGKVYHVNEYVESRGVPTQYKVFFNIALFCGMRKGEILALHWDDIDFENKQIQIKKSVGKSEEGIALKTPKTKTSIRTVSLTGDTICLLKKYKTEYQMQKLKLGTAWKGEENLFTQEDGKLMGYSTPYHYFLRHIARHNEWVENNKILTEKEKAKMILPIIPLHGLRHSCATLLNYLEVDIITISKLLGHAQASTTMNVYAHTFEELNREASDKMGEWLKANA